METVTEAADTVTGADFAKALAPVAIALGMKLALMYAIKHAIRNAAIQATAEDQA